MRARILLLIGLAAAGCHDLKLRSSNGALAADDALVFKPTVLGYSHDLSLRVRNGGASPHTAKVSVAGSFQAADVLEVPGGAEVSLPVKFAPLSPGDALGALTLESDGQTLTVALRGSGLTPAHCATPGACHAVDFDPETNSCVPRTLDDGTSCSANGCIVDGQCRGGACVGEVASCDDSNACTVDACDATQGCLHVDISATCPAPTEPCKVALCDPGSGCGVTDAPDGTVCGSVNCDTAHVCLMGSCQAVSVPDGYPCAPQTPCQGEGTCQSHVCVQPAQAELTPAWRYDAPLNASVLFSGVLDASEDLYWVECGANADGGCDLVSSTREGFMRYRAPLGGYYIGSQWGSGEGMLALGPELVLMLSDSRVQARSLRDGALSWESTPALARMRFAPDGGPLEAVTPTGLAAMDDHTLAARFAYTPYYTGDYDTALMLLELDGGATRATADFPGSSNGAGVIVDGFGRAWLGGYFYEPDGGWYAAAMAVDSSGQIVDRRDGPGYEASAVLNGTLVLEDYSTAYLSYPDAGLVALGSGTSSTPWYGGLSYAPVGNGHLAYIVSGGYYCGDLPPPEGTDFAGPCGNPLLTAFDPTSGAVLWVTGDGGWNPAGATQPMLTDQSAVVFATGNFPYYTNAAIPAVPNEGSLVSYDSSGRQLFDCAFPDAGYSDWIGGSALGTQRWFVARMFGGQSRLEAYDIPGVRPAPHGWVTLQGNLQQTGQPR